LLLTVEAQWLFVGKLASWQVGKLASCLLSQTNDE